MTSMGEVFNNQTTDAAKQETQASRVQRLLSQQEEEIRQLKAQIAVMKHDLHWAVRGLEGSEVGRKHDLARIEALERLEKQMPAIIEYLESQADVVDGDNGIPHPNKAMTLLVWLRHEVEKID
mgnify:FL=1